MLCGNVLEEVGASLPGSLEETGTVPVWKRCGRVIRAAWAADLKWAVRMRARETELVQAACESERTKRSNHGHPDRRKLPDVLVLVLPMKVTPNSF